MLALGRDTLLSSVGWPNQIHWALNNLQSSHTILMPSIAGRPRKVVSMREFVQAHIMLLLHEIHPNANTSKIVYTIHSMYEYDFSLR